MEGAPSTYDVDAQMALLAAAGRKIGIIIVGIHSSDWMDALGGAGSVWTLLPEVGRVDVVASDPGPALAKNAAAGLLSVVIPLLEPHTRPLARNMPGFFPAPQVLDLLADKLVFGLFMQDFAPAQAPALYTQPDAVEFPCVVKCTTLNSGSGVEVVHNAADLAAAMEDPRWRAHPKLIQGLIPGACEGVTHAICQAGQVLWHISYDYEMPSHTMIRRPGTQTTTKECTTPKDVLTFLGRLTSRLGYEGPLNVDYKRGPGGLYVFEVNPRLGGSLMIPAHGAHLARALRVIIAHAVTRSLAALIRRSPLFRARAYASTLLYPIADTGELARHYLVRGGLEGRDPGPDFSSTDYLNLNGAHCPAGVNPLLHHILAGARLGLPKLDPERRRVTRAVQALARAPAGNTRDKVLKVSASEALRLIARENLSPPGNIHHYSWELDRFYDHLFVFERADTLAVFTTELTQYDSTPLPLFARAQDLGPVMANPGRHLPFWYHQLSDFETFLEWRSRTSGRPRTNFPSRQTFRAHEIDARYALERRPLNGAQERFSDLFTHLKQFGKGFNGPECLAYYCGIPRCAPIDWFFTYELVERASNQVLGLMLTLEREGAITQLNLTTAPGHVRMLMALAIRDFCSRGARSTDSGVSGYFGGYKTFFFPHTLPSDASGHLPLSTFPGSLASLKQRASPIKEWSKRALLRFRA